MTNQFDLYCESIINELLTAKNKRRQSRYWSDGAKNLQPRKVTNKNNKSDSQASKMGNQQYIGSGQNPRGKNKSEKSTNEKAIAKGLGGYVKRPGVNPKKPGAKVNSKQGNMIIKHRLADGRMKVGSAGKTEYKLTKRKYEKTDHKVFAK